jgi:hypothetical protein
MRLVVRMVPLCAMAAVLAAGRCDAAPPAKAKPISDKFTDDFTVFTALVAIAEDADLGILIVGEQGRNVPLFAIFKDVPADEAIAMIAREAGLTVEPIGETLVVRPMTVGGVRYGSLENVRHTPTSLPYDLTSEAYWAYPSPLVDLNVENASIADAVAELNKQVKDWGWEIVIDQAVPKDARINAKVFKLPLRDTLRMMLGQTGLAMTMEVTPRDEDSEEPTLVRVIHIVPQPSISAAGTGGLSSVFPTSPPPTPPTPRGQ